MTDIIKASMVLGDCIEKMQEIPSKSIDMILVDMPYQMTALSWDTIIPLDAMWNQVERIIREKSAVVMFSAQPFTSALIMSNQKWFKHEWIWSKGRGTGFQIVKYRPLKSHENILVFGRGAVTYNPQMRARAKSRVSTNMGTTRQMVVSGGRPYTGEKPLDKKYPISVIEFGNNDQKGKIHPTQKPVDLLEYLILTYSNEGDTVLDFAAGSYSTAIACINTRRNFIGIEIDKDYYRSGRQRVIVHSDKVQKEKNITIELSVEWI